VSTHHPWVEIRSLGENVGYGRAYNEAIAASRSDFVAVLNNDAYVAPSWLQELDSAMLASPDAAACTSKDLLAERPSHLHHAGGRLTWAGAAWDIGYAQPDGPPFNTPRPVGTFSGAAALIRKQPFLSVGGFDPHFFLYNEDSDLSWRFWLSGYTVQYVPSAVAYHEYGATGGGRLASFRVYHAQRNRVSSMLKNAGLSRLPLALVWSLLFDLVRCVYFLRHGRFTLVWALLAGSGASFGQLGQSWKARATVQRHRRVSDSTLEKLGVVTPFREAASEYFRLLKTAE
jgi:GT2 family glycosyltransferase